ncbi:MAG: hypothetical protein V3T31_04345, partial [candidate division Zixibacteria bacterium]
MKKTCSQPEMEKLLHGYELRLLSESDRELFEIHLMECPCCFEKVRGFEATADLIGNDRDIRSLLSRLVDSGKATKPSQYKPVRRPFFTRIR